MPPPSLADRLRDALGFGSVVAANLRVKAASEIFVKAGRFLLVLVAARILGPDRFGLYAFAFAFGNILANASDFGLQMFLSREVRFRADRPFRLAGTSPTIHRRQSWPRQSWRQSRHAPRPSSKISSG
jgi:hypothetical protein